MLVLCCVGGGACVEGGSVRGGREAIASLCRGQASEEIRR